MTYEEFFATDEMPDVIAEIMQVMDDAGFEFPEVGSLGSMFDDPAFGLGPDPLEDARAAFELVAERLGYLCLRHKGLKEEYRLEELNDYYRSRAPLQLSTVNGEALDLYGSLPIPTPARSRVQELVAMAMSSPHGMSVLAGPGVSLTDHPGSDDMTAQAVFNAVQEMSEYELGVRVAYLEGLYMGSKGKSPPVSSLG